MSNQPTLHSSEEIGAFMQSQVKRTPSAFFADGGRTYDPNLYAYAGETYNYSQKLSTRKPKESQSDSETWEHFQQKIADEAQIARGYTKWRYVMMTGAITQILSFVIPLIVHLMRSAR